MGSSIFEEARDAGRGPGYREDQPGSRGVHTPAAEAVLVVEDDGDQAELIRRALERHGFEVALAGDGRGCLAALEERAYAAILLDYRLPVMDGLEVLARARARGVSAPVVILTAQGDERLAVQAMAAGGADFVVKTSGYLSALPAVLRKVLKQHELALENARLQRETERRLRDAEALVALDRELGRTLAMQTLLETVGRAAARACRMDAGAVFCREGARLVRLASRFADGREDDRAPVSADGLGLDALPFVVEAIDRRCPVVIADPASDPRVPPGSPYRRSRALLALPLARGEEVQGVLVLDRLTGEAVTAHEVLFAAAVAGHVALALDNARLYEEAQRALAEVTAAQERLVQGATLRALGELASGVAHHLNNLLAVIGGRAQLLLRGTPPEALRRPLEVIERAARDGAEVVRRIQEFARTRPVGAAAPVDVNDVVDDVVEMTRARWQDTAIARGIRIDVVRDATSVPPVLGQAAALRELVMNLVLNAVDAMPDGGRITIQTRHEGERVVVRVTDSGVGMSADVLRRVREPFFTTKGVRSMGLGLSVGHGIVERHGGEMEIISREGQGTSVIVRLPVAPAGELVGLDPTGVRGRLRVLLVDDDAEVLGTVAELIEADGHTVVRAAGPEAALAQLDAGPPADLVLTDLGMPGMTGAELAGVVRARWSDALIGVVTGWGEDVGVVRGAEAVDFVLRKPFDLDRLYEAIGHARDRRACRRPAGEAGT